MSGDISDEALIKFVADAMGQSFARYSNAIENLNDPVGGIYDEDYERREAASSKRDAARIAIETIRQVELDRASEVTTAEIEAVTKILQENNGFKKWSDIALLALKAQREAAMSTSYCPNCKKSWTLMCANGWHKINGYPVYPAKKARTR